MNVWTKRFEAAAKIDCRYYYYRGHHRGNTGRHRIIRDGVVIAHGSTFNEAMRYAVEAIYAGEPPPVPRDELLVG